MAGFSALGTKFIMSTDPLLLGTTGWSSEALGDLTNISGPTMSAEEIDVSSHDSEGNFREFVAGFLDAGEISFEGNLTVGGGVERINTAFGDRANRYFAVVFPATGTASGSTQSRLSHWFRWQLEGAVTGVETAAPFDDKATFSGTVRVSGQPILSGTSDT
jgi:predicted secreted protein